MFRRSRFSVRPNIGTGGRAASAPPQETPAANQEASETPKEAGENIGAATVTNKPDAASLASGDGNDQNGDSASSSAALQRRKRFSIKPKVAPGRPPALSRTPKSPVKAASATLVGPSVSDFDQPSTSSQTGTAAAPEGLQSPRRRRQSEDSNQQKIPPKPTPAPSENSGLSAVESPEQTSSKKTENTPGQDKQASLKPDKVPPSLPDKEATEISEKAKTLVSSKSLVSLKPSALSLTRLLNTPSDLQRLVKAQKLRELLKQERWKEKRLKRAKSRQKEFTLDPAKMTMRDLIYYLPASNPMTSSLEDSAQEEETDVPPSPGRQESPERAQQPKILPDKVMPREEEEEVAAAATAVEEEEEEEGEEEEEEALMVPQVKVAEDGSLIIDEESLTVEVQRAKGPNPAAEREPIFERGSTTTYSSFRKGTHTKPWSIEETDMFYLAVSMVGTDFSMICQLFPHRARSEIKNKFKKEERENSWRIDKAFRERRKLDIEYFSKLLEKVLEVQKDRKKLRSLVQKNSKKSKTKPKGRKYTKKLSDVEEEDENEAPELEEGGEKENEDQSNEGSISASEPKTKRKRQTKPGDLNEEPNDKKNKTDEAGVPEDSEAALPEDQTNSDTSEKRESATTAKDTTIKPAKLSRGRAPTPLVPLGLRRVKKPLPSANARETPSDKADESVKDGASEEQENTDKSHLSQSKKKKKKSGSDEDSSSSEEEEEDDAPVKPQRPTRYGRVPKPPQPLNYPSKDEAHSSASEATPASPSTSKSKPKATIKRGKASKQQPAEKSKKPKLITLRSSRTEFSDDESENQWEDEEGGRLGCSSSKDRDAPLFVSDSLHTTNPEISEVDENMVELDILASMPDVLGISQDALCPDSSCHQAQHETGTAEPCEHQLDLLVDVIDFLSSEHADVSHDDSYNEAAQALLTIGNLPLSAHSEVTVVDWTTEATSALGIQPSHPEEGPVTPSVSGDFGREVTDASDVTPAGELEGTDVGGMPHINTSHQTSGELQTVCGVDPTLPSQSDKNLPPSKTGRFSMVKPKPNLGPTSGTPPPESLTEEAEGSPLAVPNVPQVDEAPSAAEETTSRTPETDPALLTDYIPPTEVKLTEEPSDNKKVEDKSDAPTSDLHPLAIQSCSFPESQFEPSRELSARKTPHESTDETVMSDVGTAETGFIKPVTSEAAIMEEEPCTDAAPVKETGEKAPTCVSSAEHSTASQKGDVEVASLSQSRRSRLPKVKPKPNLPQTSRAAKCKPQTKKETVDKDSLPSTSKQTAEVEPTCPPPPENEEMKTHVDQLVLAAASSDQSGVDKQPEPSREAGSTSAFTQGNLVSHAGTTQSGWKNETVTDVTVTEAQDGRGLSAESEEKADPALTATPVEELTVSQQQGKAAAASQLRRSRLQKPKPNLAPTSRAARSKPQTSEKSLEKDLNPSANPEFLKNIIAEVEPQPIRTPAPEKLSESTDPTSGSAATSAQSTFENQNISEVQLEPSRKQSSSEPGTTSELIDEKLTGVKQAPCLDSTPVQERDPGLIQNRDADKTPTVDLEPQSQDILLLEKQDEGTNVALVRKENLGAFTPDPGSSETQSFSKVQSEPHGEKPSGEMEKTSVFTDENLTSHPAKTEVTLNDVTGDSASTESHLEQPSNVDSAPVQDQAGPPSACDPTAGELLVSKEATTVLSHCQPWRSRSDPVASETQSISDVLPVQDQSGHPATPDSPVDKPTVSKEETEVTSRCQPKRSRLQKPKPNLQQASRTVIFKPETTKQPAEEDLSSSLKPELDKKTIAEVKPHSESVSLSEAQGKSTDVGLVNKEDIIAVRPDLVASENPNISEVQPESSQEQIPEKTVKTSKVTDENLTSNLGKTESLNKVVIAGSLNTDSTPVQDQSGHQATSDAPVDKPSVSKEETEVAPCQPRRSRLQKPKPNLQQASRSTRFKTQTAKQPAEEDLSPSLKPELDGGTVAEVDPQSRDISSAETRSESINVGLVNKEDVTGVRSDPVASETQSISEVLPVQDQSGHPATPDAPVDKPSVSKEETEVTSRCQPKRSRLQKPKPNLQQASRSTRFKPQTSKKPAEEALSPHLKPELDKNIVAVIQPQLPETSFLEKQSENKAEVSEGPTILLQVVNKPLSPASRPESSDNPVAEAEAQSTCCSSPPEGADSVSVPAPLPDLASSHAHTQELSAAEQEPSDMNSSFTVTSEHQVSNNDQVETNSTSLGDCEMGQSTRVKEVNSQQMTDPTESKTTPACSEGESSVQGAGHMPSELTDSHKATRKAPQPRRGRLIKPKPNLRCSSRPPQSQQVDSVPAEAESGSHSQDSKAMFDHKPEPEPRPEAPESELGKSSTSSDAPSALDCVSQVLSAQNPSTSSAEGIQNFPLLFDMLPEQVPSDPDEPFFMLSLTEIPAFLAEEEVDAAAVPLPCLPVTDPPVQQPSVPGGSLAAEADGSTSNVPPPVSAEERDVVDLTGAGDAGSEPAVASSHQLEDPVDPQRTEGAPETVDSNRPEASTSGQKLAGAGRRAKGKAKPSTKREKRSASMATETELPSTSAAQDSNQPEPHVQPKASDDPVAEPQKGSSGRLEVDTETGTGGKEADDTTRLQTGRGIRGCRKRKAKDFPSFLSEMTDSGPRPATAASKRAKVKAPFTEGKQPSWEPVASTSRDVAAAQPVEVRSASSTSSAQSGGTSDHSRSALASSTPHCSTAEASTSQEGDVAEICSVEEEPTNVSQYFFSDIFTEVEEE